MTLPPEPDPCGGLKQYPEEKYPHDGKQIPGNKPPELVGAAVILNSWGHEWQQWACELVRAVKRLEARVGSLETGSRAEDPGGGTTDSTQPPPPPFKP
jgi:hypothetical protein